MIEVRLSPEAEADLERLPTQMKYRIENEVLVVRIKHRSEVYEE